MGVNPLFPLAIIVALRVITAVVGGSSATTGSAGDPCPQDPMTPGVDQCPEPSLFSLVGNYVLGTVNGAPDAVNLVLAVINFVFLAIFVLAVYQLIRGI